LAWPLDYWAKNIGSKRKRMKLENLKNKKILILGLGQEGMDNFSFLRKKFPAKILGLADQKELKEFSEEKKEIFKKERNLRLHLGQDYLSSLKEYDIILKSPGVPLKKIKPWLTKKQRLTSQTEIFFSNCPGKIIGITGTKGKGTTVSLTHQILKSAGLKVHLIGNIGEPVLSYLQSAKESDVFVYELSSHQLQGLKKSPPMAVFLNLYQAHLDHFENFEAYKKAKENIGLYQSEKDHFIFNKDQEALRELAERTKAEKVSFGLKTVGLDCYLKDDWIFYQGGKIIKREEVPLIGDFNLSNVMAAISLAKLLQIDNRVVRKAIRNFKSLPHRLEFVGKFKQIEFYNDSLATIPEATCLAVKTLKDKLETIMLGGHEAKQNFKELVETILDSKIKNLIFFPPTGQRIYQEFLEAGEGKPLFEARLKELNHFFVDNMRQAVKMAFEYTEPERICLLSCACPSFGIFKNYKERGELFKKHIKEYG